MRKVLIGLVVLVIVVGAGFYALFSSLDGLIVTAVEKAGSQVTGVSVKLDKAAVSLTSGEGSLTGLSVGNPKGFETANAFSLGSISISLDTASVTSDPVVIKKIVISKPNVTYEVGSSGSNIDAIQKNVENFIAATSGGPDKASSDDGSAPKLVIENLYIRGGEVNVSAAFLGGKTLTTPLPDLHLKDIGKDSGGASPGEIASKVIDEMTASVGTAVGALNLDALADTFGKGATAVTETVTEGAKTVTDSVGKGVSGAGDALKDVGGAVGGKLKGLFGK